MEPQNVPSAFLQRFIDGLAKEGVLYEEVVNGTWRYCGGTEGRHLNYYMMNNPNRGTPELVDKCVCGQKIRENCYITNGERIVILGNCCIKKFVKHHTRTCEICNKPHKNRTVNKCNDCRPHPCEKCRAECMSKYKFCYTCAMKIKAARERANGLRRMTFTN